MDMSKKCAGQVLILSWFDDFWQSYALLTSLTLENLEN
jgi:hypothetical protein